MAIPQTFIQELLARADVVEVVGKFVQLKKTGANFSGLCPFHSEKSPSFTVSPSKQFYHCFGCGKNGNAIGFLMDHAGMNFVEAVKDLAQQFGMQVPEEESSPEDRERAKVQREKQHTLVSVLEEAASAYKRSLKESQKAVNYLKGRGLSGDIAHRFGLGYAKDGWRNLASVFPHYDDPLLEESGLVITQSEDVGGVDTEIKRYDRFRDRVMFPIRNIKGECIGFGGRVFGDEKPKYLNSPETPVFSKGRELYGLFEARDALREAGFVLVTEGYMDVVALAQLGFPNAVATLGTACTNDHVQKLFRFTNTVIFSFDGDAAGRRAARKALDAALAYATDVRSVKFLFLPPEHDPDSFIREFGKEAFARQISEAVPLSRFLIDSAREGCDLNTAEGRSHLASNAKPLWNAMPDGALKLQLLSELSDLVGLTSRELSQLFQKDAQNSPLKNAGSRQIHAENRPFQSRKSNRPVPLTRADRAVRIILGNSQLWEQLTNEDHSILCHLPAPHGALFAWLESQLHEYGAASWPQLQMSLAASAHEESAMRLMTAPLAGEVGEASEQENFDELRDLLNRLIVDHLKGLESEALEEAKSNPAKLKTYRELQERRKSLQAGLHLHE